MNGLIIRAAQFAERCHRGQVRKYNGRPYITHPCRVAGRAATHPLASPVFVAAAYLHDVIEDCGVTWETLCDEFGNTVAELVLELTNKKYSSPQPPRSERKRIGRELLANASRRAQVLKMMDRIDNLTEMGDNDPKFMELYKQESVLLANVLRDADEALYVELMELCE